MSHIDFGHKLGWSHQFWPLTSLLRQSGHYFGRHAPTYASDETSAIDHGCHQAQFFSFSLFSNNKLYLKSCRARQALQQALQQALTNRRRSPAYKPTSICATCRQQRKPWLCHRRGSASFRAIAVIDQQVQPCAPSIAFNEQPWRMLTRFVTT
jgi:hypothetical protein